MSDKTDIRQTYKEKVEKINEQIDYIKTRFTILDKNILDVESYLRLLIDQANEIKHYDALYQAYAHLASYYIICENDEEALAHIKKANTLIDYRLVSTNKFPDLSNVYMMYFADLHGDVASASKHYKIGVKYAIKHKDERNLMFLKNNFSSILIDHGSYEEAIKIIDEVEGFASKEVPQLAMYIYDNKARAFYELQKIDQAREYYNKSYKMAREVNDHQLIINSAKGLAKIYAEEGNNKKATDLIESLINLNDGQDRKQGKLSMIVELSTMFLEIGLYEKALSNLEDQDHLAQQCNDKNKYLYYSLKASVFAKLKDFESAYEYEKLAHESHILYNQSNTME